MIRRFFRTSLSYRAKIACSYNVILTIEPYTRTVSTVNSFVFRAVSDKLVSHYVVLTLLYRNTIGDMRSVTCPFWKQAVTISNSLWGEVLLFHNTSHFHRLNIARNIISKGRKTSRYYHHTINGEFRPYAAMTWAIKNPFRFSKRSCPVKLLWPLGQQPDHRRRKEEI